MIGSSCSSGATSDAACAEAGASNTMPVSERLRANMGMILYVVTDYSPEVEPCNLVSTNKIEQGLSRNCCNKIMPLPADLVQNNSRTLQSNDGAHTPVRFPDRRPNFYKVCRLFI